VLKILLDDLTQLPVDHQLGRLGAARALVGQRMRGRRPVAAATIGVASQLPADRRRRAPQPTRDRAHRLAPGTRQRDLLALGEVHTPAREVAATARAHPAGRAHPLQPTPAMRPDHRRGVGEKLTTRERRPEPLVNLGHHPRLEDRHVSHTPVVASGGLILRRAPVGQLLLWPEADRPWCCDHRGEPRIPLRALRLRVAVH